MQHTTIEKQKELSDFVSLAKSVFKKDKTITSLPDGEPHKGDLFAVKWGMMDDCILVFRVSEDFEPVVFDRALR